MTGPFAVERVIEADRHTVVVSLHGTRATLTPEQAGQLRDELDEAAMEPERCRYYLGGCSNWAVDGEHCGPHIEDGAA